MTAKGIFSGCFICALITLICGMGFAKGKKKDFEFVTPPAISEGPNASTPLVAILEFSTNTASHTTVVVSDADRSFELPSEKRAAKNHRIVVLGLRSDTTHTISLTASKGNGNGGCH